MSRFPGNRENAEMKIFQSRSGQLGAAFFVIGMVASVILGLADKNDPDYAPPRFVVSSIVAAWMVVVGVAAILFSFASNYLGATACLWLGLGICALGILKLFAFEFESVELWRVSRVETIRFDLLAAAALALGGALALKSVAMRRRPVNAR